MHMINLDWVKEFPGAITICDTEGIILDMNDKAIELFHNYRGKKLIGTSLLDCHTDSAREKLKRLMETKQTNSYTIEKNNIKKLIYQTPWSIDGKYKGFIEISIEIPENIPHFIRTN